MKIDGFLCYKKPIFIAFNRKMLQIWGYVTELLNVCYISMNTLDITGKRDKIIVSKKG